MSTLLKEYEAAEEYAQDLARRHHKAGCRAEPGEDSWTALQEAFDARDLAWAELEAREPALVASLKEADE